MDLYRPNLKIVSTPRKLKIINDPVYNAVRISSPLIFDIISHPYFQRLRRISQMGLSYLVYPGAHHTRFHHAMGAMHLMEKAIRTLRAKGVAINDQEEEGLLLAILLHDIGHGPFSHALEYKLIYTHHEMLTLAFMQELNKEFKGALNTAIAIFKGEYPRAFLNQLVSSQLDVDRLDYLKRDSFYAGVTEGNINSERLINTFYVVDDQLVIEEKGIYSVEKFLMARRFMYWQVYLHKTSIVAEIMLSKVIERARELLLQKDRHYVASPLDGFLNSAPKTEEIDLESIDLMGFAALDDFDVISALKSWKQSKDFVLSFLSRSILDRTLLEVRFTEEPVSEDYIKQTLQEVGQRFGLDEHQSSYLVYEGALWNRAYDESKEPIRILFRDQSVQDFMKASKYLGTQAFSAIHRKNYLCSPAL